MELPIGPVTPPGRATLPNNSSIHGRHITLVPVNKDHVPSLHRHLGGPDKAWFWTYTPQTDWTEPSSCEKTVEKWMASTESTFYAVEAQGSSAETLSEALGMCAYISSAPEHRRIEVGLMFGERLRGSRLGTEAIFSLIRHAFDDLGYLRVEWKTSHLNVASQKAARRLGFTYEGTFRQHLIEKGRRRDSVWFSIISEEWPEIRSGFERWLADENFDEDGGQRRRLQDFLPPQTEGP